jgi:hypothetical protein
MSNVFDLGNADLGNADLGSVDPTPRPRLTPYQVAASVRAESAANTVIEPAGGRPADPSESWQLSRQFNLGSTLSLFLPGVAPMTRGQLSRGLFFLSAAGFLAALTWALLSTVERLAATFGLFGLPRATGVWALGVVYLVAASLHLASVLSPERPDERDSTLHPAMTGVASALVPGWGQLLNGNRRRAALFVGGLWAAAASWILVSPQLTLLMDSVGVYLPVGWRVFTSPAMRWILPAVIWTLAVYDAATTSIHRRG